MLSIEMEDRPGGGGADAAHRRACRGQDHRVHARRSGPLLPVRHGSGADRRQGSRHQPGTYNANNDSTQELANVQDAITKGVDGILIYSVSLSLGEGGDRAGPEGRRADLLPVRLRPVAPQGRRRLHADRRRHVRGAARRVGRQAGRRRRGRDHQRQARARRCGSLFGRLQEGARRLPAPRRRWSPRRPATGTGSRRWTRPPRS